MTSLGFSLHVTPQSRNLWINRQVYLLPSSTYPTYDSEIIIIKFSIQEKEKWEAHRIHWSIGLQESRHVHTLLIGKKFEVPKSSFHFELYSLLDITIRVLCTVLLFIRELVLQQKVDHGLMLMKFTGLTLVLILLKQLAREKWKRLWRLSDSWVPILYGHGEMFSRM